MYVPTHVHARTRARVESETHPLSLRITVNRCMEE